MTVPSPAHRALPSNYHHSPNRIQLSISKDTLISKIQNFSAKNLQCQIQKILACFVQIKTVYSNRWSFPGHLNKNYTIMAKRKQSGGSSIVMHGFDNQIADNHISDTVSEQEEKRTEKIDYKSPKNGAKLSRMNIKTRRLVNTIEYVADIISKDIDKDIAQLTPYQRVSLWKDLQEYLRPKLARKEIVGEDGGPVKTQHTVILKPHASPALSSGEPIVETMKTDNHTLTSVTQVDENGTISHNISTIRNVPDMDEDVQEVDVEIVQ
jgi:hypothetical protein